MVVRDGAELAAGRATLRAFGSGFALLLGELFSFFFFLPPLLLDPVLRLSFLELDAVAPRALKGLEWSGHL